jgi:hypothetical protein
MRTKRDFVVPDYIELNDSERAIPTEFPLGLYLLGIGVANPINNQNSSLTLLLPLLKSFNFQINQVRKDIMLKKLFYYPTYEEREGVNSQKATIRLMSLGMDVLTVNQHSKLLDGIDEILIQFGLSKKWFLSTNSYFNKLFTCAD